jgi:hypothetical protein
MTCDGWAARTTGVKIGVIGFGAPCEQDSRFPAPRLRCPTALLKRSLWLDLEPNRRRNVRLFAAGGMVGPFLRQRTRPGVTTSAASSGAADAVFEVVK